MDLLKISFYYACPDCDLEMTLKKDVFSTEYEDYVAEFSEKPVYCVFCIGEHGVHTPQMDFLFATEPDYEEVDDGW